MTMPSGNNLELTKAVLDSPYSILNNAIRMPLTNIAGPSYVQLESTTKCNYRCSHCIRSPTENYNMSFDLFKSILDQLHCSRLRTQHVDLTGIGEPLLNPNLVSMVRLVKEKGFKTGFTTNFSLMKRPIAEELINAGIDYIFISMDSANKEAFEKIRIGGDFEKTLSLIRSFVQMRDEIGSSKPILKLSVTLYKENLDEIFNLVNLAEELKVDSINFSRPIMRGEEFWKSVGSSLSTWKGFSGFNVSVGRYAIPLKRPQPCLALKGCFITYDGYLLPCNSLMQIAPRDEFNQYALGNLEHEDIYQIWRSNKYRKFRTLLTLGKRSSFCKHCPRPYQI